MSDEPQTQGRFTIPAAREALRFLRKNTSGALLVTSGLQDVRLIVEGRRVTVEAEGFALHGDEERDLVRAFLSSVFWEQPSFFLDPSGKPTPSAATISIQASQYEVLNLMDRGLEELQQVQARVSGMDLLVSVGGEPPPKEIRSPTANLYRVLARTPNGGHLGSAAEQARLDVLDAAWSINDLLDSDRASLRRPPAPMVMRRLAHAEGYADRGLLPAARYLHLARGFSRADPGRAARLYQDAAANFLIGGFADHALLCFRNCLELAADNVAALEGMANALEELKRVAESKRLREKLVKLYLAWNMPSRARQQLERIPQQTPEQRELLLDCMLKEEDFPSAFAMAQRLAPTLSSEGKIEMAERFARSGARGKELDKVVTLCGLHSLGAAKTVLKLLTAAALLAAVLLGGEAFLRLEYANAVKSSEPKMAEARFAASLDDWSQLTQWDQAVGASQASIPFTSLGKIEGVTSGLKALQKDVETLRKTAPNRELLARWDELTEARHTADVGADFAALKAMQPRSDALRARVAKSLANIEAYRAEAEAKVKDYKVLPKPLKPAQELLSRYANVRKYADKPDLYNLSGVVGKGLTLAVKVNVAPKGGVLYWRIPPDEEFRRFRDPKAGGAGADTWPVRLPFETAADGMILKAAGPKGYIEQELTLKIADLKKDSVDLKLIRSTRQTKDLEFLPPAGDTRVMIRETKKGGDWALNFKQQGIVPDPGFESSEGSELIGLLKPLIPTGWVVYIEFENHCRNYNRFVYTKQINVWLRNTETDAAATPRKIDQLGVAGKGGLVRTVEERTRGQGDWVIRGLDRLKNAERRRRTQEALTATVRSMLREARAK